MSEVVNQRFSQRRDMVSLHFVERVLHAVCHRYHLVLFVMTTRFSIAARRIHRQRNFVLLPSATSCQSVQAIIRQRTFIIEAQQIVLRHCFVLWFFVVHLLYIFVKTICSPFVGNAKSSQINKAGQRAKAEFYCLRFLLWNNKYFYCFLLSKVKNGQAQEICACLIFIFNFSLLIFNFSFLPLKGVGGSYSSPILTSVSFFTLPASPPPKTLPLMSAPSLMFTSVQMEVANLVRSTVLSPRLAP